MHTLCTHDTTPTTPTTRAGVIPLYGTAGASWRRPADRHDPGDPGDDPRRPGDPTTPTNPATRRRPATRRPHRPDDARRPTTPTTPTTPASSTAHMSIIRYARAGKFRQIAAENTRRAHFRPIRPHIYDINTQKS